MQFAKGIQDADKTSKILGSNTIKKETTDVLVFN